METTVDTKNRTNKLLRWAVGFFLFVCIVYGFSGSALAGVISLVAFLITLPTVNRIAADKIPQLEILSNQYVKWSIAAVLTVLSFYVVSLAENAKIVDEYNKNKTQILEDVISLRKEKKFWDAEYKLKKYADAIKNDSELNEIYKAVSEERSKQWEKEREAKLKNEKNSVQASGKSTGQGSLTKVTQISLDDFFKLDGYWVLNLNNPGAKCDDLVAASNSNVLLHKFSNNSKELILKMGALHPSRNDSRLSNLDIYLKPIIVPSEYQVVSADKTLAFFGVHQSDTGGVIKELYEFDLEKKSLISNTIECKNCNDAQLQASKIKSHQYGFCKSS